MLVIRNDQLFALQVPAFIGFERDMMARLELHYPIDRTLLGEDGLLAVIREARRRAIAAGFVMSEDVARFVTLSLVLGSGFADDPLLPWASGIVKQAAGEPGAGERLVEEAAVYIELTSGADGRAALVAMLRAVSMDFETVTAIDSEVDPDASLWRTLRRLWPWKHGRLLPAQRAAFLATAKAAAAVDGMDAPGCAGLHAMLAFLLGTDFSNDPALPWARATLTTTTGAPSSVRARALYDAGVEAMARLKPLLPVEA